MVDVGEKATTQRLAVARGRVRMAAATMELLLSGNAKKGDVLATARIAGIQAAKRTPELIPLCHAIGLTSVELHFEPEAADRDGSQDGSQDDSQDDSRCLNIAATVRALDRTGAEMEALTAVSVAALTVYDMLKAVDRAMVIEAVALHEKSGGKSGHFVREQLP